MDRLDRHVPGTRQTAIRALEEQLFERDRELRAPRKQIGEDFKPTSGETRPNRRTADPHPNAPLLKRLVLYPYVQECAPPKRDKTHDRSIPWDLVKRVATPSTWQQYLEAKPQPIIGNPLRNVPIPVHGNRPRPSASDWLGGDE